jgi:hypothetical protein
MKIPCLLSALAGVAMILPLAGHAAPPMATEDASTLDPTACQLEFERRTFRQVRETDLSVACNLMFDAELGATAQRVCEDSFGRRDYLAVQFKKVLLLAGAQTDATDHVGRRATRRGPRRALVEPGDSLRVGRPLTAYFSPPAA